MRDRPNFLQGWDLDHLLGHEIYVKPNFVKIVQAVLEIINIYLPIYLHIYVTAILACLIISGDIFIK